MNLRVSGLHQKPAKSAKMLMVLAIALFSFHKPALGQDDYDKARERCVMQLTGGPNIDLTDPTIAKMVENISEKAFAFDRKINRNFDSGVFTDMTTYSEANLLATLNRLKDMATAYATSGSPAHNNAALKNDILSGMDCISANWYSTNMPMPRTPQFPQGANWFTFNIAAPEILDYCMVLMYPALSKERIFRYCASIDYFDPNIAEYTGANLAWVANVILLRGIVAKDAVKVQNGILGISKAIAYVALPIEGFNEDGSHTAHKALPYNGGYGPAQFHNIIAIADMLSVTRSLKITGANASNVYRIAFDSFKPLVYKGEMMPMVMGRYVGRVSSRGVGNDVMENILFLLQSAPTTNNVMGLNFKGEPYPINPKLAMQQWVKYWLAVDHIEDHAPKGIYAYKLYQDFLKQNIQPAAEQLGHYRFPSMDRVVHLRPNYGFGLSMFSTRIKNYEDGDENKKGWHSADGMTYLFNDDQDQYDDNFWPTVDVQRLPGTTVALNTIESPSTNSDQNWVGGCDLNANGVSGMSLNVGGLAAKKSWFMFDNEIVALGAGITSTSENSIETVAENRKLNSFGDNTFIVNGITQPSSLKKEKINATWAHLAGKTKGADIGYYFYKPTNLNYIREKRTGTWHDVSKNRSTEQVSNTFLTLYFDHGIKPVDSTYAYVILPNKSAAEVKAYSITPGTIVLSNTKKVQAVIDKTTNTVGANFWTNTTQSLSIGRSHYLTCSSVASIMTHEEDGQLELAVSDPTQANKGNIIVEVNKGAINVFRKDPSITVIQTSPTIKISVNANNTFGRTQHILLQTSNR